jgi:D-alanyl-D-alanine carboxypeptidase
MKVSLLVLASLTIACTGQTDDTSDIVDEQLQPFDPALAADLEEELQSELDERGVVGMTLAVQLPDTETLLISVGTADLETDRALEPTDRFRIASVSKTFTAALILQLVDEGLLSVDDLLADHLDLLEHDTGITIAHLLNHSAGVPEYSSTMAFQLNADEAWTDEELVALVAEEALLNEPGEAWAYTNTHYVILGMVAESLTGEDLPSLFQDRLFDPLGLNDTALPLDDWGDIVPCYVGEVDYTDSIHPTGGSSAGGVTSSPADLLRWGTAFGSGELISSETYALQQSDPVMAYEDLGENPGAIWDGLGILLMGESLDDPELELGHNGALNGASAWMGYRPGRRATMVILGNSWPESDEGPDISYPLKISWDLWDLIEAADSR